MPGENDIDITQDLVDGSEGSLADTVPAHTNGAIPQGADASKEQGQDGNVGSNKAVQIPTEEKADTTSLRDQLSNAFKGEEPAAQVPVTVPTDVPQLTKDTEGKYRQADGTFASNEQIAAFEAAQTPQAPDTNAQQQAPSFLQAMTPIEQEQFKALPAETRQFVERTMEAVNSREAQLTEYGLLEQQLLGPRRQAWAQQGMTPAVALSNLLMLSDFATTRPGDFILTFAENNKIDLDALLDAREAQQSTDPTVRALQGQVQQLQSHITNEQTLQQQQRYQADLNRVQTFALEKDGAGALKRPYLTEVNSDASWANQIQAVRAANPEMQADLVLQKAYENACWANPGVRQRMQEEAAVQQREAAARKVAAAKVAGSSVNGAPSGGGAQVARQQDNANTSIRDDLKAAFAEHAPA